VGGTRPSGTSGILHQVTVRSLLPATSYQYRVRGPRRSWSRAFTARTAPRRVSSDFDFAYVADTGLIGRSDGLATGTKQVIAEIAKLNPLFVLGGGDFAYYSSDKRYGSLDNSIDAWFNQMQPVAARAPLMPAYGNHEILLKERYEDWAPRFPTPTGYGGFDNRQNYSFEVGDVHFVSILSVRDGNMPLPQEQVNWIDQDIAAAQAARKRWIIPFMHAPAFGDGENHRPNRALRDQLSPIFERYGVKLVIASHDQAYERSYPLVGVTSTRYTATSTDPGCYTRADGVTYVKVSPGGKLSNISGGFSPFRNPETPSWTAYRNNTIHNFAHVRVSRTGVLQFATWGVKGDGSPPVLIDSFRYTIGSC